MPSRSDNDGDDEGLPAPEPNAYKCDAELLPHLLVQQAIRGVRVEEFRERTARLSLLTAGVRQSDSVDLLREDRER